MPALADPPVRADGLCGCGCGKRRMLTVPKKSGLRGDARADLERLLALDPFASSGCARRWHGCELPVTPSTSAQTARAADTRLLVGGQDAVGAA